MSQSYQQNSNTLNNTANRYWQNWDNLQASYKINQYWEAEEGEWRNILAANLSKYFGKNSKILEVGCGSGLIYDVMLRFGIISPESYSGGDISQSMLQLARQRDPKIKVQTLDIFKLNLDDSISDNVINIHVMQHLPHYRDAVLELMRVTKKRLYIACWFNNEPEDSINFCEPSDKWDNQQFYNNTYSLNNFIEYVKINGGDSIANIEINHFGGSNYGIVIDFNKSDKYTNSIATNHNHESSVKLSKGYLVGIKVRLRNVSQEDLNLLVTWRNDPQNWKYFFNTKPIKLESQKNWLASISSRDDKMFFMIDSNDDVTIGTLAIDTIDYTSQRAEIGNVLIGDKEYINQGYAYEALCVLLDYCFLKLNIHRVELKVQEDNLAAITLYKKAGFVVEGVLVDYYYADGKRRNALQMSKIR